jgi:hypothetical protein
MPENTTIRVVAFREGDLYVAQALEVDVCAQGRTAEEAMSNLRATLRVEAEEALASGRTILDIGPAPHAFYVMFANNHIERMTTKVA